jgi:hypothetical protein
MNTIDCLFLAAFGSVLILAVLGGVCALRSNEDQRRALLILTVVCTGCLLVYLLHDLREQHDRAFFKESHGLASTILSLGDLQNGTYSVIDTYRDANGDWLAILSPGTGTPLDSDEITIDLDTFGKMLVLVNIGTNELPSHSYKPEQYTGCAKVDRDQNGVVTIRTIARSFNSLSRQN